MHANSLDEYGLEDFAHTVHYRINRVKRVLLYGHNTNILQCDGKITEAIKMREEERERMCASANTVDSQYVC